MNQGIMTLHPMNQGIMTGPMEKDPKGRIIGAELRLGLLPPKESGNHPLILIPQLLSPRPSWAKLRWAQLNLIIPARFSV